MELGDYKPAIPLIVHSKAARLRYNRTRQTCAFAQLLARIAAVPVDLNQAGNWLWCWGKSKFARVIGRLQRQPEAFVEAEELFSVAAIGNDRLGSTLMQLIAQLRAVEGLIAEHVFRWFHSADQAFSDRAVVRFTSRQQDCYQAPFSICECMDLRVAPSLRRHRVAGRPRTPTVFDRVRSPV